MSCNVSKGNEFIVSMFLSTASRRLLTVCGYRRKEALLNITKENVRCWTRIQYQYSRGDFGTVILPCFLLFDLLGLFYSTCLSCFFLLLITFFVSVTNTKYSHAISPLEKRICVYIYISICRDSRRYWRSCRLGSCRFISGFDIAKYARVSSYGKVPRCPGPKQMDRNEIL